MKFSCKYWPILTGLLLRLVIFNQFKSLPPILDRSVECSTPVTSFNRLQEGVYQYTHNASPYEGVFHQSPLLLALFTVFSINDDKRLWIVNLFYSICDIFIGFIIMKIGEELNKSGFSIKVVEEIKEGEDDTKNDGDSDAASKLDRNSEKNSKIDHPIASSTFSPTLLSAIYLFNPLILLSTFSRSTTIFTNLSIVASIYSAIVNRSARSIVLIALASTLSFYPIYLTPALGLLIQQRYHGTKKPSLIKLSILFLTSALSFLLISYIPTSSFSFINSTYGVIILFKDLTPNIGLWWYFFTEMFDFFRPFFTGVFQLYTASFSLPITIRFHESPLFSIITILGIVSLFKSYPEIGDIGFYLSLLPLYKPIFDLLRYPLISGLVLLYCSLLAPTFYYLWIYLGSGNSNFFYAITLVHALGMSLVLSDTIWAALRLDYDGGKNSSICQI